jgi:hypothetical protein
MEGIAGGVDRGIACGDGIGGVAGINASLLMGVGPAPTPVLSPHPARKLGSIETAIAAGNIGRVKNCISICPFLPI